MSKPLSMAQAAAEAGLGYERFRKVWREIPGFPAPIRARVWDADAVAAWKAQRSGRPADNVVPIRVRQPDLAAARARLAAWRRA